MFNAQNKKKHPVVLMTILLATIQEIIKNEIKDRNKMEIPIPNDNNPMML